MRRKGLIISGITIVFCLILAAATKLSLQDSGRTGVADIGDLESITFSFSGVLNTEWLTAIGTETFLEEAESADTILVVRAEDKAELYDFMTIQYVEVVQVLRGTLTEGERIRIADNNGLSYMTDYRTGEGTLMSWSCANILYTDRDYLVFLQKNPYETALYDNCLTLGALQLEESNSCEPIDMEKQYTYGELRETEFFADSKETLEMLYTLKAKLLSRYLN